MTNCFIQNLRGFAELTHQEIAALEDATRSPQAFGPRKHLSRDGDRRGAVFVMLEGWAFRYKVLPSGSRQIMAFLMPGDVCDLHTSMVAEMDHNIQTATDAKVATISRATMDGLINAHPGIARAIYISQLGDHETLCAWIMGLGRHNSAERAAHLLLELCVRAVRAGAVRREDMELPLSQALLADAFGMSLVHLNRVLKELRQSGAIELRRGALRVLDGAALSAFSGFDENYLQRRLRKASSALENQSTMTGDPSA